MNFIKQTIVFVLTLTFLGACKSEYTPKPKGYFRIDLPQKKYQQSLIDIPYTFEYPEYTELSKDNSSLSDSFWYNLTNANNKVSIHLSYKKVNNNLAMLTEDSHELAYKHSIKANAINEQLFMNPGKKVYGTIYNIKGNAASPMQFHLTDSVEHFVRGSFYISEIPNYDSLMPVINFYEEDILHLIETFSWK